MKLIIVMCFALFVLVQNVFGQLNELIDQNVRDASESFNQLMNETDQRKETPRLWIHVRNRNQEKAVTNIQDWLKDINLDGRAIDLRPLQLVKDGPADSQLRFFKTQDKIEAEKLLRKLQKILPNLHLNDLSRQFGRITWIKAGHYELWFSPNVTELKAIFPDT